MNESSGRASSFSDVHKPVNGSDPVEEKRETMLGWNDLENMVDQIQKCITVFDHLAGCVTSRGRKAHGTSSGATMRCQPWTPMTGWLRAHWQRTLVRCARDKVQRRSLASLPPDERFDILFLGRDEFSCSVLKELHVAKGMAHFTCGVARFYGGYTLKDVWQSIALVTHPDHRTGRRGNRLSICALDQSTTGSTCACTCHLTTWSSTFEIAGARAGPGDTLDTLGKIGIQALGRKLFCRGRTILSADQLIMAGYTQPPAPFVASSGEPNPKSNHVLVTASFGRILRKGQLELFSPGRRLNVHPSLLPHYRGPAPIQHALLNGEKETGVCVIEMLKMKDGAVDSGDIWGRENTVSDTELFKPRSVYRAD